ncbi:MAG: tetratricopeptide repeat protein [Cyclobacteriaceae bacterium]|nr:tetratricopeptide repeat protein [Cyclobacteriaceae bacterium]MCH8516081.1 tetratricopeptide repeat protein [Cyclobacteriaceae bacterium]
MKFNKTCYLCILTWFIAFSLSGGYLHAKDLDGLYDELLYRTLGAESFKVIGENIESLESQKQTKERLFLLAKYYEHKASPKQSKEIYALLRKDYFSQLSSPEKSLYFYGLAYSEFLDKNIDASVQQLERFFKTTTSNNHLIGSAYHLLGNCYFQDQSYKDAEGAYKKAIESRKKVDDNKGMAASLNNLANIYLREGKYNDALEKYETSLLLKKEIGDLSGASATLNNIASIYYYQNQWVKALEMHLDALNINEELEDSLKTSYSLNNIGLIYHELRDFNKAVDYFFKAIAFKIKLNIPQSLSATYNNLGMTYSQMGNLDSALNNYDKAINLSIKIDDDEGFAAALNNRAKVFQERGLIKEALNDLLQSFYLDEASGNQRGILQSKTNIGEIYLKLNELEKAQAYIREALALSITLSSNSYLSLNYLHLSDYFDQLKSYDSAFFYLKRHTKMDSMLQVENNEKDVARIEAAYEFDKKMALIDLERENEKIMAEKRVQKAAYQRNGIFLITLFFVFVALAFFFNRKKLIQLNSQINEERKQLRIANLEKAAIFATVGHDVRGPISSVIKLMEMSNTGMISLDEMRSMQPQIHRNLNAISLLLENILNRSVFELNKSNINIEKILLYPLLDEVRSIFEIMLKQKSLRLDLSIHPSICIYGDRMLFSLILRNLLNNAIKYSESGTNILIEAYENAEGKQLIFSITNIGKGMTPEEINLVLNTKTMVKSKEGSAQEKGNGLGLILTKEALNKMGGTMDIDSNGTNETSFILSIPTRNSIVLDKN